MDFLHQIALLLNDFLGLMLRNIDTVIKLVFVLIAYVIIMALIKRLEHQKVKRW